MPRLQMPSNFDQKTVLLALQRANLIELDGPDLEVIFPSKIRSHVSGIVTFASWFLRHTHNNKRISFPNIANHPRIASMLNICELIGQDLGVERITDQDCLPIHQICNDDDIFRATNALCEMILKNTNHASSLLPAIEWCVNEAIDNILRHSDTAVPGCVCATINRRKQQLSVAIGDSGRGILETIRESYQPFNVTEAIQLAITKGITRNPQVGQGFGLAGNVELLDKNKGLFELTSEDIRLSRKYECNTYHELPKTLGTQILLTFDVQNPISLEETTIIGTSTALDWNYFDVTREKLDDGKAILVRSECVHIGGRGPAKALRTKILSLIEHTPRSIELDFSGVDTPASSFLDELLGRMSSYLGPNEFRRLIKIQNMSPLVEKMSHNVIEERLRVDGVGISSD
jgi:hypothetical protein